MKKFFAIFLMVAALAFMFSCGEEEQQPENNGENGSQVPGPENNYGDFDGNGTTDSLDQGFPIVPVFPE